MEARLTRIDRLEALRYLRVQGGTVPKELDAALERCIRALFDRVRPRAVWRLFDREDDGNLAGADFIPAGEDIRAHLDGCRQVILMAATLGAETESLMRRTQARSMADAVILDAAASAAIENVCDTLCAELAERFAPRHLTARYSPGYGDFPLEQQAQLCRVLDVGRKIGVSLSPGGLMLPQKTVTALIGVSDRPARKFERSCSGCPQRETCVYRKDGTHCGNTRNSIA